MGQQSLTPRRLVICVLHVAGMQPASQQCPHNARRDMLAAALHRQRACTIFSGTRDSPIQHALSPSACSRTEKQAAEASEAKAKPAAAAEPPAEAPEPASTSLEAATAALQAAAAKPDKVKLAEQQYAELQLKGAPEGQK